MLAVEGMFNGVRVFVVFAELTPALPIRLDTGAFFSSSLSLSEAVESALELTTVFSFSSADDSSSELVSVSVSLSVSLSLSSLLNPNDLSFSSISLGESGKLGALQ